MRTPSTSTSPVSGATSPRMTRATVDLPDPLDPSRTWVVPDATCSETSSSATVAPKRLLTWWTAIMRAPSVAQSPRLRKPGSALCFPRETSALMAGPRRRARPDPRGPAGGRGTARPRGGRVADHVRRHRLDRADVVRSRGDTGVITPFLTLYALHDALVKPMPGNAWAPCLAE